MSGPQPLPAPAAFAVPPPKKPKAAIAGIVILLVIILGLLGYGLYQAQQAALARARVPNIVVTEEHGFFQDFNDALGCQKTTGTWTALLVNTGGGGFVDVKFTANDIPYTYNTYFVQGHSQLQIVESVDITPCITVSVQDTVITGQRAA